MWVDFLLPSMEAVRMAMADRALKGWAHGGLEAACLNYDSTGWRATFTTHGRGARKDARVVRRLLRRTRQRQAAITRQQDAFQDYLWKHRHPYGWSMPRRIVRGLRRWPCGDWPWMWL